MHCFIRKFLIFLLAYITFTHNFITNIFWLYSQFVGWNSCLKPSGSINIQSEMDQNEIWFQKLNYVPQNRINFRREMATDTSAIMTSATSMLVTDIGYASRKSHHYLQNCHRYEVTNIALTQVNWRLFYLFITSTDIFAVTNLLVSCTVGETQ